MTSAQKTVKYLAIALAIFLIVNIFSTIIAAVAFIGGFGKSAKLLDEPKVYELSGDISSLDIEISAAEMKIVSGDRFSLESNIGDLNVKEVSSTLRITEKKTISTNRSGAFLTLTIPAEHSFKKIEISTGAGRLMADRLSGETVSLELGAGEVVITELVSEKSTEINGGTGAVTIGGGSVKDLDMDLGVGRLTLRAAVLGESDIDSGVGNTKLTLLGDKDSYKISVNKGLGTVRIDGTEVGDESVIGDGKNKLELNTGVGSLDVTFENAQADTQ